MIKANGIIASEAERWNQIKRKDLKKTFNDLAESQIEYYKNVNSNNYYKILT